jgi:hypothetical protein
VTDKLAERPPQSFADILATTKLSPELYKAMWGVTFGSAMAAMKQATHEGYIAAGAFEKAAGAPITPETLLRALVSKSEGEPIHYKLLEPYLPKIMAEMPWWWRMRLDLMAAGHWNWNARRWWARRIDDHRRPVRRPDAANRGRRRANSALAHER